VGSTSHLHNTILQNDSCTCEYSLKHISPSQVPSNGGGQYFMTFIENYSRNFSVYFLKKNSDVFVTFKQWKALIENKIGKQIQQFRIDNCMKFCGGAFNNSARMKTTLDTV